MREANFIEFLNLLSDSTGSHSYCFILGSGASFSSGIPTGTMLTKRWLGEIFRRDTGMLEQSEKIMSEYLIKKKIVPPDFTWENIGSLYSTIFRTRFPVETDSSLGKNALKKLMTGKNPSFGYSALAKILTYSKHRVVITTNFDHLIEDSIQKYAQTTPQVIHSKDQAKFALIKTEIGPPVVLKLHGDNFFETKNLEKEIELMDKEWSESLKHLFQRYTPIFIGYGGHDPGFTEALASLDTGLCPHPPIWCYYHHDPAPTNDNVKKFLKNQNGLIVKSPDFDESMLLLSNAFKIDELEEKHKIWQENNKAAWRREFEHLCQRINKDFDKNKLLFSSEPNQYANFINNSIEQVVGKADSDKDWWQWQYLARIKKSLPESLDLFDQGKNRVSVPEALEASRVRFLHDRKKMDYKTALQEIKSQYQIAKRKYSDDHPDTLSIRLQLARILTGKDNVTAKEHYHEILIKRRRILGNTHPDTIASLRNLSQFYLNQDKNLNEAQALLQEAIQIHKDIYGDTHWLTRQLQEDYENVDTSNDRIGFNRNAVVMIHQPHFFPWLGYFNKIANCDVFVALDNVQYRDRYFQNRTKTFIDKGKIGWMTIPVNKKYGVPINETPIADENWKLKMLNKLQSNYYNAEFFDEAFSFVEESIQGEFHYLSELTIHTLRETIKALDFPIIIKRSSDYPPVQDRTERIIKICNSIEVSNLIYGEGQSFQCHDFEKIQKNGINIKQQRFKGSHPKYKQFSKKFYPNLSILDCFFHCGISKTAEIVKQPWRIDF